RRIVVCRASFVSSPSSTVKRSESGMAVLAHDLRSDERCQLGSRPAFVVLVGKFENRRPLTGDRVLPDLTDLDRGAVRWAARIGVRHASLLTAADLRQSLR